jgi:hypothetical protein
MEPESSLPYSQVSATCPYREPAPSSSHNPLPLTEEQFTTLSNNMADARTSKVGHRLAQFNTASCFEKL